MSACNFNIVEGFMDVEKIQQMREKEGGGEVTYLGLDLGRGWYRRLGRSQGC